MLADTIEDHELIDPMLSAERLLVRLFHERGVRAFEPTRLKESLPMLAKAHRFHVAKLQRGRPARDDRR